MGEAETPEARFFRNDQEAIFLRRPNRFVAIAGVSDGARGIQELTCHLPNPGRMLELLRPGVPLILEKRGTASAASQPRVTKTQWTVAAVRLGTTIVPLNTQRTNEVVAKLVLPRLYPGARSVQAEYSIGSSRFDFLVVTARGERVLLEVKTCSLVAESLAMFPDAPSERARRHAEELAALGQEGYRTKFLFAVVHGEPERLVPNLHTDPAFAATLTRLGEALEPQAILLHAGADGQATLRSMDIPVDLSYGQLAEANKGSYLVTLEIEEDLELEVGSLGVLSFPKGWYVYCGSAQKNLGSRLARHLRKNKRPHWHLDYLSPHAARREAFPFASDANLECNLAHDLASIGGTGVPHFGSSDCHCPSHLYFFPRAPKDNDDFVRLILRFRHTLAIGGPRGESAPRRLQANGE